jgi:hypothetical protein
LSIARIIFAFPDWTVIVDSAPPVVNESPPTPPKAVPAPETSDETGPCCCCSRTIFFLRLVAAFYRLPSVCDLIRLVLPSRRRPFDSETDRRQTDEVADQTV